MSIEDVSHQISTRIDQKFSGISETSSNQLIFRVDNILRMTKEAAYEPEMVSIGPYHRGKNNLQKMEKYKLKYLQGILGRQNKSSAWTYINSLIQDEIKARSYYAEQVSLSREEFMEMMLLDGCFIVEFLRKYGKKDGDLDPIFKMEWILVILRRDLLLFENQIPFFIMDKLFDMTKILDDDHGRDLVSLAISCLNDCIVVDDTSNYEPENFFHLLSLMYGSWCSSFAKAIDEERKDINVDQNDRKERVAFSCITLGEPCFRPKQHEINFIKSVSELKQDGIKFTKSKQSTSWLDIKFENGEIIIPPLVIQDGTESIFRNLIAYEQYMFDLGHSKKYVTVYTTFMDCLIDTPMDAQKLRVEGIIKNWLGNDEEITNMFNNIGKNVFLSPPDIMYREIFDKVNEHCNQRCNSWINDFKNKYFKSLWSISALLASTALLVLTLIQTIFSFLQYFNKDPKVVCNCK